jgi:gas vesicle protein
MKTSKSISSKSVLGILGAAAAGVAIGMLFAPDKGTNTRKKLAKKGKDYGSELRDKFGNIVDKASKEGKELIAEGKNKYDTAKHDVLAEAKDKYNQAKSEIKREF